VKSITQDPAGFSTVSERSGVDLSPKRSSDCSYVILVALQHRVFRRHAQVIDFFGNVTVPRKRARNRNPAPIKLLGAPSGGFAQSFPQDWWKDRKTFPNH
jgi:hypothetical protein